MASQDATFKTQRPEQRHFRMVPTLQDRPKRKYAAMGKYIIDKIIHCKGKSC
jgi:hypothetical protein